MASSCRSALALLDNLRPAAHGRVDQLIWLLGGPLEPARLPKNLDLKPVLAPDRHGRRPKTPHGAAFHTEIDHRIILKRAARDG